MKGNNHIWAEVSFHFLLLKSSMVQPCNSVSNAEIALSVLSVNNIPLFKTLSNFNFFCYE